MAEDVTSFIVSQPNNTFIMSQPYITINGRDLVRVQYMNEIFSYQINQAEVVLYQSWRKLYTMKFEIQNKKSKKRQIVKVAIEASGRISR